MIIYLIRLDNKSSELTVMHVITCTFRVNLFSFLINKLTNKENAVICFWTYKERHDKLVRGFDLLLAVIAVIQPTLGK